MMTFEPVDACDLNPDDYAGNCASEACYQSMSKADVFWLSGDIACCSEECAEHYAAVDAADRAVCAAEERHAQRMESDR